MTATPATIAFRGSTLRCWVHGSQAAPWLVMSHGMGLDSRNFDRLAERLSSKWRVLRWDLPGHGESGAMPDPFDISVCVDALGSVLDAAGIERAMLLGFSFGGIVSQLFAHRVPGRVDGLIAYGCLSPLLVQSPPAWVRWLAERIVTRGSWEAVRARFARSCSIKDDVRRDVDASVTRLGEAGFRKMLHALLWVPDHDPAFRVDGPVMWIQGVHDSNDLRPVEAAFRRNNPGLRSEIIRDAGHCAHQDNPKRFDEAIGRFLDDVLAPRR